MTETKSCVSHPIRCVSCHDACWVTLLGSQTASNKTFCANACGPGAVGHVQSCLVVIPHPFRHTPEALSSEHISLAYPKPLADAPTAHPIRSAHPSAA